MKRRQRAATVLTHNRQELLLICLEALRLQVDEILVIDNASDPPALIPPSWQSFQGGNVTLLQDPEQPPNLSRMWNLGIDYFVDKHEGVVDIAVVCDDAIVPAGWFDAVTHGMRQTGAVIGCSNPWGWPHPPRLKTAPDRDVMGRMPGHAWIIDGSRGVRADERFRYWYGDTKIDTDARRAGGMVMVGGFPVPNMKPDDFITKVPGLAEQAAADAAMYAAIEGATPWP